MKIYLASPYTSHMPVVRRIRFQNVNAAAANLLVAAQELNERVYIFSPISHSHPIALDGDLQACDHDLWLTQCVSFLEWADIMVILKLEGWEKSIGIAYETGYMEGLKKPIISMPSVNAARATIKRARLTLKGGG